MTRDEVLAQLRQVIAVEGFLEEDVTIVEYLVGRTPVKAKER